MTLTINDLIGKRIRLIEMFEDPDPIKPGSEGVVKSVGYDVIQVIWDCGRTLGVIWEVDKFEVIGE